MLEESQFFLEQNGKFAVTKNSWLFLKLSFERKLDYGYGIAGFHWTSNESIWDR